MILQDLFVAVIVAACTGYAAWTLMPAASRRWLARRLLTLPLPDRVAAVMRRHATASSAGGCDGCDHAPAKQPPPAAVQPIRFLPRPPR